GAEGDADARSCEYLHAVDNYWFAENLEQMLGRRSRCHFISKAVKKDGEFVATEASKHVTFVDAGLEAICDGLKDLVSHRVAERVVHQLESIQVEEKHSNQMGPVV